MGKNAPGKPRQRGHIRRRGNSFQALVYAGTDPLTGKPHYLSESTGSERAAQKALTRLLAEVDEQRNARTKATFGAALDEWLKVHEVEPTTRQGYEANIRVHIKPALGHLPIGEISVRALEGFYAELRRCRARCDGRPMVDHRTTRPHECRTVRHRRRPGRPSAQDEQQHDCDRAGCVVVTCPPHVCESLSASSI